MEDDLDAYRLSAAITNDEYNHSRDHSQDRLLDQAFGVHQGDRGRDSNIFPPIPVRYPDPVRPSPDFRAVDERRVGPPPPSTYPSLGQAPQTDQPGPGPENHHHRGYAPVQRVPDLWRPIWLRKAVLSAFILLFAASLTALVVLRFRWKDKDGFTITTSTSHYTGTYAPTAVLVIILAFWRCVDYYCKLLTPWAELRNGPAPASKSVLLDYVSPLQLGAFFAAIKKGHWAVLASLSGLALLILMTILSTGLFFPLPTNVADLGFPLIATTTFDASTHSSLTGNASDPISGAPVYAYFGSIAHALPLEAGVTSNLTYQTFNSNASLPSKVAISAEVDAFVPRLDCSVIDSTDVGNGDASESGPISLKFPAGNICQVWPTLTVPAQDPRHWILPSRQLSGTLQALSCVEGGTASDILLYTMTDIRYQQSLFGNATQFQGGPFVIASDASRTVAQMVNVACVPSYAITKVKATKEIAPSEFTTVSIAPVESAQRRALSGFSGQDLTDAFQRSLDSADTLFGFTAGLVSTAEQVPNTIFHLMAITQGSDDYDVLLDSEKMKAAAEMTFRGITSHYVHRSLTTPSQERLSGIMVHSERRLQIQPVSLWFLVAGFALLILLTLVVMFLGPGAVVSQDPNLIGTMATILTRSNDLQWMLQKHGVADQARLTAALAGYMFHSAIVPSENGNAVFKIVMEGSGRGSTPGSDHSEKTKWWRPTTLSIPFLVLTLLLPLAVLAVLEVLQHLSNHHNGLFTIPSDSSSAAYTHYIPALITLFIATLFNSFEFNISLLSPFAALQSGNASSHRTLTAHLLGKLPPHGLLSTVRTRHFGAGSAIAAAILASALTVLVSGLYTIETFSSTASDATTTRPLSRLDTFDLNWPHSVSNDSGAAAILSLLEHNPAQAYPAFVHDDLAFPQFDIGDFKPPRNPHSSISAPSTAVLPALRTGLVCTVLDDSAFNVSTLARGSESAYPSDMAFITAQAQLPDSCALGGTSGNGSFVTYRHAFALSDGGKVTYGGQMLDLLFGVNASIYGNYGENHAEFVGDSPAVGCPSLAFTVGKFELGKAEKQEVTTMVCFQQMQVVDVNVTLADAVGEGGRILEAVVDESSIEVLVNPRSERGVKTFEWRIQQSFQTEMQGFEGVGMDRFFQALTQGRNGVELSKLVGGGNEDQLVAAITTLYKRYMALAANAVMRRPCRGGACPTVGNKTRRDEDGNEGDLGSLHTTLETPRLVQNTSCKIALQVLLAVMVALGAMAMLTTKTRKVVPVNVCSIAGTMALLAGSELCYSRDIGICECCGRPRKIDGVEIEAGEGRHELMPEGAEWMMNRDLERALRMFRFSMGWWRERGDADGRIRKKRRFGIDMGMRADGSDDQDWVLGSRNGGVEARGLGSDDFMMTGGLAPSPDLDQGDVLGGPAQRRDGYVADRVSRFQSLRGHGDGRGVYGPADGDVMFEHDQDEEYDEEGGYQLRPVASAGRRVQWAEQDQVMVYDGRSEDAVSSRYSESGIGSHSSVDTQRYHVQRQDGGLGVHGMGGEA